MATFFFKNNQTKVKNHEKRGNVALSILDKNIVNLPKKNASSPVEKI